MGIPLRNYIPNENKQMQDGIYPQVVYEDGSQGDHIVKQGDDSVYDFQEVPISSDPKMEQQGGSNMASHRKRNKCKERNTLGQCKLGPMAKRERSINAQNVPFIPTDIPILFGI